MLNFAPGPISVPEKIRRSFLVDPPYFVTQEYKEMFSEVRQGLKRLFHTKNPVLVGSGSGSLAMEICVKNFFIPKDVVIVVSSGKYGDYWNYVCSESGLGVISVSSDYPGNLPDFEDFKRICKTYKIRIKGLFLTHCETTTGILLPIQKYVETFRKYCTDGLIVLDAVSTFLSESFLTDDFDIVISSSQKGLSLPSGLFFMVLSPLAVLTNSNLKGDFKFNSICYFDIGKELDYQEMNSTSVFTPGSHLIQALHLTILEIEKLGGINYCIFKSKELAEYIRSELRNYFLPFTSFVGNSVQIFSTEESVEVVKYCLSQNLIIGGGIRKLKNSTFRLQTFGWDLQLSECRSCCEILKSFLGT